MSLLLSASMLLYNLTTLYLVSRNPATLVHLVWSYLYSALVLQLTRRCFGDVVPGGKPFRYQTKPGCGSEFSDTHPWAYFIVFNIIWSSWNQNSALVLQLTLRYLGDVVVPEENLSDLQTTWLCIRTQPTVLSFLEAFRRCRPKGKPSWYL